MFIAECDLVGTAPISFSAPVHSAKAGTESADEHEERTWKERLHVDEKGVVFIPPMALKNCLSDIAKYLSERITGKGQATFTAKYEAGVSVIERMDLGVKAKEVEGEWLFVPSDGKRGGGRRVWKKFPLIKDWRTHAIVYVHDEIIVPKQLEEYLKQAGLFIGMGRFRPRRNGFYGRFQVENFTHNRKAPKKT